MKTNKYLGIFAAACMMAACQNEGDLNPQEKTFRVTAEISVPQTKTAISAYGDSYKPTWTAGDRIGVVEKAAATTVYASEALAADAESASFAVTMTETSASAYTYCAVYPYEAFKTTADVNALVCTVPAEQTPATMTSFDANADILVSELVERTTQPVDGKLAFNMRRLTATGMVSFTNLLLAEGENVIAWTLKVDGALAGTVNVAPSAESLDFTAVQTSQSVKVILPVAQTSDFTSCFTCLPYTIQTGDNYYVTIHTNKRNITKQANVSSALEFASEKVMHLTVNMSQTANSVSPLSFTSDYDYVITTTVGGITYVLPNDVVNRRPAKVTLEEAGLSTSSNGTLTGDVAERYRWSAVLVSNNEGLVRVRFYHMNGSTRYDLINGPAAQGFAVLSENSDDTYSGYYDVNYTNKFEVHNVEGGYALYGSDKYWGINVENSRWQAVDNPTPIRFHRISQVIETTPGIINNANDVTAGKYVVAGYSATSNTYYLLSGNEGASPDCSPAASNGISLKDDKLTEVPSGVSDEFVWNVTPAETEGYWNIRNISTDNYLYGRESGGGVLVGKTPVHDKHSNEWIFKNVDGVMAVQANGCVERYLSPYFNATDSTVKWYMQKIFTDYILLIPINE